MSISPGSYRLTIIISFSLVIINIIVGRFFAPLEFLTSLFLAPIFTCLIAFIKPALNIFYSIILIYSLIALNDLGIKLWGGGIHDVEGQGVTNLVFIINATFSAVVILLSFIKNIDSTISQKTLSLCLFLSLIFTHLQLFGWVGVSGVSNP